MTKMKSECSVLPVEPSVDVQVKLHQNAIWIKCPVHIGDRIKLVPTMRWVPSKVLWVGQYTPAVAHALISSIVDVAADVDPDVWNTAQKLHRVQEVKTCPIEKLSPIARTKTKPWPHQLRSYHLVRLINGGTMLSLSMGCGKTFCIVSYIMNDIDRGMILIVCPKAVVPVWPKEFAKHALPEDLLPHETEIVPLCEDTVIARAKKAQFYIDMYNAGKMKRLVFVINYESAWRDRMADVLEKVDWKLIVADESHMIKSPSGVASRFMASIGKKAERRVCLTGTPMAHSPLDVYGQYRFLDAGVFGTSFTLFRSHYALMGGFGNHQVLGYKNQDDLNGKFYSIAYRVIKEEVLTDLPEYQHVERYVELEKPAQRIYQALENEFICEVMGNMVTVSNAMVKVLRLQQLTSGFSVTEEGKVLDQISAAKANELRDIFEGIEPTEPVVVICRFSNDVATVKRIAEECSRKAFELSGKVNELADWQAATGGEVLAMQIQTGRAGIEVTRAKYCVYYSIGCSLSDYEQSLARMHRPGQKRNVTYLHLLASGTVDEKVYAALMKRKAVIQDILEQIKSE